MKTAANGAPKTATNYPPTRTSTQSKSSPRNKDNRLRVAVAAESELLRIYLKRLLADFNISVVASVPLELQALQELNSDDIDVLHVEMDSHLECLDDQLYELFNDWKRPILFNDSLSTEASLSEPNRQEYGRKLSQKLFSLAPDAPQSVA